MDSQTCWVPRSIVFNEAGFKYIEVFSKYGDIGLNPPGPRGNQANKVWLSFPEYEITSVRVNCNTRQQQVSNIATLTSLLQSDPEIIELGQGDRGEKILSVIDPISRKKTIFFKPLWVVIGSRQKYRLVKVLHVPTLNKVVDPICDTYRKFWRE